MRKTMSLTLGILFLVSMAALVYSEGQGKMTLKAGDEVYACNCGENCPCQMMARQAGNCTCGQPMAMAKVKSVGEGTAVLEIGGKERTFKTVGKYMCGCGPACKCGTISQSPGKCPCGKDMVEVK
jgi:hypothetical protein